MGLTRLVDWILSVDAISPAAAAAAVTSSCPLVLSVSLPLSLISSHPLLSLAIPHHPYAKGHTITDHVPSFMVKEYKEGRLAIVFNYQPTDVRFAAVSRAEPPVGYKPLIGERVSTFDSVGHYVSDMA